MTRTLILSLFLLSSCADLGTDDPELVRQNHGNAVCSAVYRYQFQHNGSVQQQSAKVYFLAIQELVGGDAWRTSSPNSVLIHQFEGHDPPVKLMSEGYRTPQGVFDRKTGEQGLEFWVYAPIPPRTGSHLEVVGGFYEEAHSQQYYRYLLEWQNGQWIVARDTITTSPD